MKTLANCSPREFLRQTNRIRRCAERWLDLAGLLGNVAGERERGALVESIRENPGALVDAALEKYPDETAELMGLMCFIEPDALDGHSMVELLGAVTQLLECREVVDFFISLALLERMRSSGGASR